MNDQKINGLVGQSTTEQIFKALIVTEICLTCAIAIVD